jgi:outer membrane protein
MKSFKLLALTALLSTSAHAADLKFAVVDMAKAFTEYYKTKDASARIKGNRDKALSEANERYAVYKNLLSETQKASKEAQDPVLSQEARLKAQATVQDKGKELRALEQEISEFQNRRSQQIQQEQMQLQRGLYEEIVSIVREKSKSEGMDFVFDKSGISINTVPVLLYYKDAQDITDQIIVELNKNAPAPSTKPAEEEKPAENKKGK